MHDENPQVTAVSVTKARELLGGIANPTIYRLINSGELKTFRIGKRRMVSLQAIQEFIENSESAGA